jgi:hypothetical protein
VLLAAISGCGSGDDQRSAADSTAPSTHERTTAASSTSRSRPARRGLETTTTAGDRGEPTALTGTTEVPLGATEPAGPAAPLTGMPGDGVAGLDRPALVLKIDNHRRARPQVGLDEADIVFDLRAEGVTRFAAVFHSNTPETVGPIRSSRTSDFDLLRGLDSPLYGSSGGNQNVMAGLQGVPAHALTNQTRREYFRDGSRPAPHNLFIHPADLYDLAPGETTGPSPWFEYRSASDPLPSTATRVSGPVTVAFTGGPKVGLTWDPGDGGWLRTQDGQPHLTADGDQLAPANVVIMVTTYGTSAADAASPEVRSTGSGELFVLTAGQVVTGTWERKTATDKPVLRDDDGDPIRLTPGQTWVLYPQAGQTTV